MDYPEYPKTRRCRFKGGGVGAFVSSATPPVWLMADPNPIRPRVKDMKALERSLKKSYLDPFFARLQNQLLTAQSAGYAFLAIDKALGEQLAKPYVGVPVASIEKHYQALGAYHRWRTTRTIARAIGVDVRGILQEAPVADFLRQKVQENVDLIKTIPQRTKVGMGDKLFKALNEQPFDKQMLTKIVRTEYKSQGHNLRRIVRDQTSKTIGQLTEIRQTQLGIPGYTWSTAGDGAVRPTHVSNGGQIFRWDSPPAGTGHPGADINCRCVARPLITNADKAKLVNQARVLRPPRVIRP